MSFFIYRCLHLFIFNYKPKQKLFLEKNNVHELKSDFSCKKLDNNIQKTKTKIIYSI